MDVIYLDHNIFIELIQNKIQLDNLLKRVQIHKGRFLPI